jgi:fatty-acyl-CoA synthase
VHQGYRRRVDSWSFDPLTPTAFLNRTATVHPERIAIIDGERRFTYAEMRERCAGLAGSLHSLAGGGPVAVLAPNSHVLLEAHYAVPWSGSPLVALNTRLSTTDLVHILKHCEASVLVFDAAYAETARALDSEVRGLHLVEAGGTNDSYEGLVAGGPFLNTPVLDERSMLSINYTSGTTGSPKGVMYHHRGAYLQALAMVVHAQLQSHDTYLWTLPMFHCNGWCFTWATVAAAATNVCLRQVEPAEMWRLIDLEDVSVLCGAPTVLSMLGYAPEAHYRSGQTLRILTGGAPPTPAILTRMEELGARVTHLYGLTETFGPIIVCDWHPEWDALDLEERAKLGSRQGVPNVIAGPVRVLDEAGADVPADGRSTGEVAVRGNDVMLGYLHDPEATRAAIPDGWFRTGDIGVTHADGYIELKDRSKDVIISGGENISSIEVEAVLCGHPAVLECAVYAVPDAKWGEVPAALVTLKDGSTASAEDLIVFARDRLAHFKAPKQIAFGPLPKNPTGKVQKFALREAAWAGRDRRIG